MHDPVCAKSRTGYVIVVASFSIMWHFNLQPETTVSNVKADIVDLAHSCYKLFIIMDGANIMGIAIGLPVGNATIQILIHEDYAGALVQTETLSPQFPSQSKHYHPMAI